MKSYTEHLWFNTKKRIEFINITNKVQEIIDKSKIKEGLVLVNAMHITAWILALGNKSIMRNLTGRERRGLWLRLLGNKFYATF